MISLFITHVVLFLLIKLLICILLTLSPLIMKYNQKRCHCGHVAAVWDTHTDLCRSCCGCSRELPCGTSKSWSPTTWEKMASARLYSSRRRKSSGSAKRADMATATSSQSTPTSVAGCSDSQLDVSLSTTHAPAGGAEDTVSAGKSLP